MAALSSDPTQIGRSSASRAANWAVGRWSLRQFVVCTAATRVQEGALIVTAVIIPFQASARPLRTRGGGEVIPFDRSRSTQTNQTQCGRDARSEWLRYQWGEIAPQPESEEG
jgi:hypothetical protein